MVGVLFLCLFAVLGIICNFAAENLIPKIIMTSITINIPNHEVGFFKKMISKMGWTYNEANVVRTAPTSKELTLAKIDHAFGQLHQMKEGQIEGIDAEELFNEL